MREEWHLIWIVSLTTPGSLLGAGSGLESGFKFTPHPFYVNSNTKPSTKYTKTRIIRLFIIYMEWSNSNISVKLQRGL